MAESLLELRAAQYRHVVKGCVLRPKSAEHPTIQTRIYTRKEIDVFAEDDDCCNLFLLALLEMQDGSYSHVVDHERRRAMMDDPFSWYSICAIHGRPYGRIWGSVNPDSVKETKQWNAGDVPTGDPKKLWRPNTWGYCSHASVLFPTWHRLYLALMEQTVSVKMHEIALRFPRGAVRDAMVEAAYRFRFPYWDPLRPRKLWEDNSGIEWQCGIPKILSSATVRVRLPTEDQAVRFNRRNPLYSYVFPEGKEFKYDQNGDFEWTSLWGVQGNPHTKVTPNQCTLRCPDITGLSNHTNLNSQFVNPSTVNSLRGSKILDLGSRLYNLLSQTRNYNEFSNNHFWSVTRNYKVDGTLADVREPGADLDPVYLKQNPGESDADFERRKNEAKVKQKEARSAADKLAKTSIEGVHDTVHAWCGRSWDSHQQRTIENRAGHMSEPALSAFDPIFWLHHMQVERTFCMWQTLYGSVPFAFEQYATLSTTAESMGLKQTHSSPLTPFWKSREGTGQFWTSTDCVDWTILGYDYEETGFDGSYGTAPGPYLKALQRADLTRWINTLYKWTSSSNLEDPVTKTILTPDQQLALFRPPTREVAGFPRDYSRIHCVSGSTFSDRRSITWDPDYRDPPAVVDPTLTTFLRRTRDAMVHPAPLTTSKELEDSRHVEKLPRDIDQSFQGVSKPIREWDAHVRWKKFALDGSFIIYFFIGDFNPNPLSWNNEPALAATIFNWASSSGSGCVKCREQAESGLVLADTAHLTSALLPYISTGISEQGVRLKSLEPEDVIPFLQRNLHWRIQDIHGKEHSRDAVGALKVAIADRLVTLAADDTKFPVYGEYTRWTEITDGRPGGLGHDEGFWWSLPAYVEGETILESPHDHPEGINAEPKPLA